MKQDADAAGFAPTDTGPPAVLLEVTAFDGTTPGARAASRGGALRLAGSRWNVSCAIEPRGASSDAWGCTAEFVVRAGALASGNVAVRLGLVDWSTENYVLAPAAAYNGNRFRSLRKPYPPMLHAEDGIAAEMPVTITDVPCLSQREGLSALHLRSGDMATPSLAIHFRRSMRGLIFLAEHDTPAGYTGLRLEESADRRSACLRLEAPAVRSSMYLHCRTGAPSDDAGWHFRAGDHIALRFNIYVFDCADVRALFARFFEVRQDLAAQSVLCHGMPFSSAFRVIEQKFLDHNWNQEQGYLRVDVIENQSRYGDWQAGWVGGGMSSLAFLADGSAQSRERARRTIDSVFSRLQAPSGFIYPIMHDGRLLGDDFCHQEDAGVLLIRKNTDVLLFAARHILLLQRRGEPVPPAWIDGLRKLAGAIALLWDRHGQLGQFVDLASGDIIMGGTASGSSGPGGLALASRILGDERLLRVASAMARYYHVHHVEAGLLNGGPGEILQCADSESAFNLLESLMTLYDATADPAWLPLAEDCAHQCATWCVSYDFHFPSGSVFAELGMRTTGSVFANVQNKHSAPGICTLSGASLLKLYRATQNERYLRLCREIAHNITQYLSRADRPIRSWDGRDLPAGTMCERVNMSDWETKQNVGGVFYGSCWCEVSCLLTYVEVPGVWVLSDTGEAIAFDHVEARIDPRGEGWRLSLANPTPFDAEVKLLVERRSAWSRPLGEAFLEGCPVMAVPARGEIDILVPRTS